MAEPLKITGDVIRDEAELTSENIQELKSILIAALRDAPVEPRAWVRYIGRALEKAEAAERANESVKRIIYDSRRRNGKESE